MSAARQAAEAAFAAPSVAPMPDSPALVTVRRARVPALALVNSAAVAGDSPGAEEPLRKDPRVFRIDAARKPQPLPSGAAGLSDRPVADSDDAGNHRPRKRRPASEKRPGPVVVVVHQPTHPNPAPAPASAGALGATHLAARLDAVAPILAAIQTAQAFWFIDHRLATEWRGLSLRADELLAELQTLIVRPAQGR